MLRQLLSHSLTSTNDEIDDGNGFLLVKHFNLLPAGFSRVPSMRNLPVDDQFSDIVLESMKLLLEASLVRNRQATGGKESDCQGGMGQGQLKETERLIGFIDEVRQSGTIKMGGTFPQIIAQKKIGSAAERFII